MSKNFIVVSDIHFPYHDPKAINAVKRFIKATPIDVVVFNGDILDMYDVSSFDKSPDRINSLQEELNMAMKLFGDIRKELPEAEMVYVEGNHEYRLKRYLMRHPELFSLEALQLPNLLKLDKFNIKYTDKPYYLGGLKITHGSIVRKFAGYTAKAEMEKNDCSGISGHTHRGGTYYRQSPTRYSAWYESFCLCDIHPEYVVDPDWQQGFIFGKVNKDSFSVMPDTYCTRKIKVTTFGGDIMTDKQINTCEFLNICQTDCNGTLEDTEMCHCYELYKQLACKEQECEELKQKLHQCCTVENSFVEQLNQLEAELAQEKTLKEMYFTYYKAKHEDVKGNLFRYKQALADIKEHFNEECKLCKENHVNITDEICEECETKYMLQKISEVKNDRQD